MQKTKEERQHPKYLTDNLEPYLTDRQHICAKSRPVSNTQADGGNFCSVLAEPEVDSAYKPPRQL